MAGVYRPGHPERTVLYRVSFHSFDRFLAEYEGCFEKQSGFFRPSSKKSRSAVTRLTFATGASKALAMALGSSSYLHVVWQDITPGNMEIYYKKFVK
jgi:hypothetical protein